RRRCRRGTLALRASGRRRRLGLRLFLARLRPRGGLRALLGASLFTGLLITGLLTRFGWLVRPLLTLPSRRLVLPLRLRRLVAAVRLVRAWRIAVWRVGAACGALLGDDLAADGLRGMHLAHQPLVARGLSR